MSETATDVPDVPDVDVPDVTNVEPSRPGPEATTDEPADMPPGWESMDTDQRVEWLRENGYGDVYVDADGNPISYDEWQAQDDDWPGPTTDEIEAEMQRLREQDMPRGGGAGVGGGSGGKRRLFGGGKPAGSGGGLGIHFHLFQGLLSGNSLLKTGNNSLITTGNNSLLGGRPGDRTARKPRNRFSR